MVVYGIASRMKHSELFTVLLSYNVGTIFFTRTQVVSPITVDDKSLVPEDAHSLSDSRRLVLANLTTHLKGSSRSVMVLLVWSLNFVSS